MRRRSFLGAMAGAAVGTSPASQAAGAPDQPRAPERDSPGALAREGFFEAVVPDTLDLAHCAAPSVNALTGAAEPGLGYETYICCHVHSKVPFMSLRAAGPCNMKPVHALPMMRVMSGSTQNADYDLRMMEAILRQVRDDGLWWFDVEGKPWQKQVYGEDYGSSE